MIRLPLAVVALGLAVASAQSAQVSYYQLPSGSYPHDVAPARDGGVWFSGQIQGFARPFRSGERQARQDSARARRRAARRHRRSRRRRLGRPKADRTPSRGSIRRPRGQAVSAAEGFFQRQPQHPDLRQGRHPLVHRPERRLWACRSQDRQGRGLGVAARLRHLRHHHHARGRGLVRLARQRSHRPDRHRDPCGHGGGAAAQGRRSAPHLVGFQGHAVGELLVRRRGRALRPGEEELDHVHDAQEPQRHLCGLCGRQGPGVGDRLAGQRASSASTRRPRPSRPSRATSAAPRCGRCRAAPARPGAASPATTAWWWCGIDREIK